MMVRSMIIGLLVLSKIAPAQTIVAMEYFVDTDPGVGLATAVPSFIPDAIVTNGVSVSTASLVPGSHVLYVRSKDQNGEWSSTSRQSFYLASPPPAPPIIVAAEYFIDSDPGIGAATSITGIVPSSTLNNIGLSLVAASFSAGAHTAYVRVRNQAGVWSVTQSHTFYVEALPLVHKIVKLEYFIDSDPGFEGTGTTSVPVTPSATVVNGKILNTSVASLPLGSHTIFIRGKNDAGIWSATNAGTFNVTAPGTTTLVIGSQPSDTTVCVGTALALNVSSTGTTNITYQWQYAAIKSTGPFTDLTEGNGYSGVTTSSLTIATQTNSVTGFYQCTIAGDAAASVLTNPSFVAVVPQPPAPVVLPSSVSCSPSSVVLTASGGSVGQYRWYTAATLGSPIATEVNSTYTTPLLSTSVPYFVALSNGVCESSRTTAIATVEVCHAPVIAPETTASLINASVSIDLSPLITDADNNLDVSSLTVTAESNVPISIDGLLITINYGGTNKVAAEKLDVHICDLTNECATGTLSVTFGDDITIFNGVSANGDGKNDVFYIQYIDILPSTIQNKVSIFNRWGDRVFSVNNYNNKDNAFKGMSTNGDRLPAGVYFYKIEFTSGKKTQTGFLSLKP